MRTDNRNPWAGLASYQDPETSEQKLKFCGRDDDSFDVAKLIMGNVFVTLYGKSGIGKTSLLNAGVFPELREESFTPLSLRPGMRDEVHPQSYQTMIIETIERLVKRMETVDVVAEQTDQKSVDFLWNFFARHRFYDKNGNQTSPVVVFDQFEEVFRNNRKEGETLLRQIDYINDKDHSLDKCEVDGRLYRYEQNFRFVVSIREDDLYRLEDSIDNCYLPALKRCRYRLRSLSEEGARDAILIPGEGLFKKEEQEGIVNTIIQIARNKDDQSISTNLLSLVCSRIFVDFQKSGAEHISPAIVETFIKGNPFERFYNEATRGFSNREKSYIEDHLVDSSGRRNSIPESDFLLHVKNGAKLLEGNSRILQRINTSSNSGNSRIELIHDSFCNPLSDFKRKRELKRKIKGILFCIAIVIICSGVIAVFLSQKKQISESEKRLIQKNDSLEVMINKLGKEKTACLKLFVRSELLREMAECNCKKGYIYIVQTNTGRIKVYDYINKDVPEQKMDNFKNEKCAMFYSPTFLALLATDKIDTSYVLKTGNGVYNDIKDHNWRRGGYGDINLARALEVSSEVAFTMAIEKAFPQNRMDYENVITKYLAGSPDDPIGLLTFYNAIANNGCMVKIIDNSDSVVVIDKMIAPRKHIQTLQQVLYHTVHQGLLRKAGVSYMKVTANGRRFLINDSTYRMELCGYFPAEKPEYTIMVVLEKEGLPASAGGMCGIIMRNVVDCVSSIFFDLQYKNENGNLQKFYPDDFWESVYK